MPWHEAYEPKSEINENIENSERNELGPNESHFIVPADAQDVSRGPIDSRAIDGARGYPHEISQLQLNTKEVVNELQSVNENELSNVSMNENEIRRFNNENTNEQNISTKNEFENETEKRVTENTTISEKTKGNKPVYSKNIIEHETVRVPKHEHVIETLMEKINDYGEIKAQKLKDDDLHTIIEHYNATEEKQMISANTVQIFQIKTTQVNPMLCVGSELLNGVFLMEGIIEAKNGYARIAVANTNDVLVEIANSAMMASTNELNDFDIFILEYKQVPDAEKRIKYLRENLPMNHCSEEERGAIDWIIRNFNDVFFIEGDETTFTEASRHFIPLKPGTQPIFTPQYKIPHAHREIIDEHIDKLIADDIVENSVSRWNSPVLLVPKKENSKGEKQYRLVVDFRRLNEVTETQMFPMPDSEEELSKMHGSSVFSTMDLNAAFHQIPLAESDRELTSFQTSTRKLQFKRMPFGLKGSPITWQRTINFIMGNLLLQGNMAYMDDVIFYNRTLRDHMENISNVLHRLRSFNLKLKVEKTQFLRKEVHYLGHIIGKEGIRTDPKKVKCMIDFPTPTCLVEVQRFLGMCNYYRKYVREYSRITKPMNELTKKDVPFIRSQSCKDSFETLKLALISTPILIFPNFRDVFYVTTDASDYAVGAVLSQGTYPNDKPQTYTIFSKNIG